MCLIEDREIEIICRLYAQPLKKDEDDPMGEAGQSEGAGQPASFGAASSSTEENAERSSRSASQSTQNTPGAMPDPEEEYQIPRDKGQVMDAIAAFFRIGRRQRAGWKVSKILLEPLLEPYWVEPWRNLAGTLPELSGKISGTLLEPRWNPVAGTFGWNTLLGISLGVDFVFLFAFLPLLTVSGCDVGNLA